MPKTPAPSGPSLFSAFMELRALLEMTAAASFQPLLRRTARGDGHPVIVVPAFMTGDAGTALLRRYLKSAGFVSYGWQQGRNTGLRQAYLDGLIAHVRELAERHGGKVSLVGWSLGGVYARAVANGEPDLVRQVITLGSPFNVSTMAGISGGVAKLYEWLNPGGLNDPMLDAAASWQQSPPVPSTAIYSTSDGVADWQYCIDEQPGPETENVRVPGSHMGLTHNAAVMYAVSERLAQREGQWQPFNRNGLRRFWYKDVLGAAQQARARSGRELAAKV